MLGTYVTIHLLSFIIFIVFVIILCSSYNQSNSEMKMTLKNTLKKYQNPNETNIKDRWDYIQERVSSKLHLMDIFMMNRFIIEAGIYYFFGIPFS